MKKLILLIAIFTSAILNVRSTNYYISNSGSNSNNGLTPGTAFLTIQNATNIVVAGDCVLVANGNYAGFNHQSLNSGTSGSPIVYKALGNNVNITTKSSHVYNGINVENNNYIQIIGFTVRKMFVSGQSNSNGIRMVLADYCVIRNCILDSNFRGVLTGHSEYLLIENNTCSYNLGEHGIYVSNNADYAIVRNNVCMNNKGAGIQFNPDYGSQFEPNDGICDWAVITGNTLGKNGVGLNTQGLRNTIIANNLSMITTIME